MSPSDDNNEGSYSASCNSSSGDDRAHHLQLQSSKEEEDNDCADDARSQVAFNIRSTLTLARTTTMRTKATRWSKTARMLTRGRSKATNVFDNGWVCGFLRMARKTISNGKGNADDNLQDDAATDIFSDDIGID
jgi:hypothetical protein